MYAKSRHRCYIHVCRDASGFISFKINLPVVPYASIIQECVLLMYVTAWHEGFVCINCYKIFKNKCFTHKQSSMVNQSICTSTYMDMYDLVTDLFCQRVLLHPHTPRRDSEYHRSSAGQRTGSHVGGVTSS